MLSFFEHVCQKALSTSSRIRVCLASRHYPHITIQKGLILELDNEEGHKQDIVKYLSTELRIGDDECARSIRSELLARANGIFMWVHLVVPILNKEYDSGRIRALQKRLEEIPSDIYTLFHDILTRDSDAADRRAENSLCIQWILFSRRPLTLRQLYAAVSCGVEGRAVCEEENGSFEMKEQDLRRYLLDVSKGLAEVTDTLKPTVQFIHESVKDFFLKWNGFRDIWPEFSANLEGASHERLAGCCLAYVNIKQGKAHTKVAGRQPFFNYAVQNVLYHADEAAANGMPQTEFLRAFPTSLWAMHANSLERYPVRRYTPAISLDYVLADRSLPNLIAAVEVPIAYLEDNDERFRTPLFATLSRGHKEAAHTLLRIDAAKHKDSSRLLQLLSKIFASDTWQGKFTYKSIFPESRTVLEYLADFAQREMLELLIELHPEILDKDTGRANAFVTAAWHGHMELLTSLMRRGINVNVTSSEMPYRDLTALEAAAHRGHTDAVRVILANCDAITEPSGSQALESAIMGNFTEIADLLIANHNLKNHPGRLYQSLLYASIMGQEQIVAMLILGGANINARGEHGGTALYRACEDGNEEAVVLLLEQGADPNIEGLFGKLPLLGVCETFVPSGNIIASLLEGGASLNATNRDHVNILSDKDVRFIIRCVIKLCEERTACAILTQAQRRVDPLRFNTTALKAARRHGKLGIVRFILEQDWIDDMSILEHLVFEADERGHNDIVQATLQKFIRTNTLQEAAQTARSKNHARVERLIMSVIEEQA